MGKNTVLCGCIFLFGGCVVYWSYAFFNPEQTVLSGFAASFSNAVCA